MNPATHLVVNVLWSVLGLVSVYCALRGYRAYRTDAFREQMFALRDDLFALGASGQLSFDAPSYGVMRTTLNGFIRFGHRVNPVSFVLFEALVPESRRKSFQERTSSARLPRYSAELSPEADATLTIIQRRMHGLVLEQLLFGSPLLLLAVIVGLPISMLPRAGKHLAGQIVAAVYRRYEEQLDERVFPMFDRRAYMEGETGEHATPAQFVAIA